MRENFNGKILERIPLRNAVATFVCSDFAVVGLIIEIGQDGIALLCKNSTLAKGEEVLMDILIMDRNIFIPEVLCIILAIGPGANHTGLGYDLYKRIDGAFPKLTARQSDLISLLYEPANRPAPAAGPPGLSTS